MEANQLQYSDTSGKLIPIARFDIKNMDSPLKINTIEAREKGSKSPLRQRSPSRLKGVYKVNSPTLKKDSSPHITKMAQTSRDDLMKGLDKANQIFIMGETLFSSNFNPSSNPVERTGNEMSTKRLDSQSHKEKFNQTSGPFLPKPHSGEVEIREPNKDL